MVPDSNTISKLDTLTRNRQSKKDQHRSVSESPHHVSIDSLYSPVREQGPLVKRKTSKDGSLSPPHPPSSSIPFVYPKVTIYDHLTPRSRRKMIQEQMGSTRNSFDTEGVYSLAGDVPVTTRPPLPSNSSPHYSSFNNTQIQLGQLQNELNFVAEGLDQAGNYSSLDRRSQSPTAIYDFCENPEPQTSPASNRSLPKQLSLQSYNVKTVDGGSPSPQRRPHPPYMQPDYSSLPPTPSDSIGQYDYVSIPHTTRYSIQTQSHEGTPEAIYSLADESPSIPLPKPITPPRQSPLMIKRNATPPPPIHPKTSSFGDGSSYWSNQIRPPTNSRSASQRTTPSTTPILSRAIEHVTPSEDKPDLIYAIPDKIRKPFPKIQHIASIDNPDAIYALPDMSRKRETTPIVINDDDDDDEAPPLPPRNYDTSDIEVQ